MVIFRAKLLLKEKVSYRRQIFLESLGICFIHGYSDEYESRNFQEILSYHYENVSTKLTLALLNPLYIRVESIKETVQHLSIFSGSRNN